MHIRHGAVMRRVAAVGTAALALVLVGCNSTAAQRSAPSDATTNAPSVTAPQEARVSDEQFCVKGPRARLDTSKDPGYDPAIITGTACLDDDVQEMWMLIYHGESYWKTSDDGSPVEVGPDHRFAVNSPDTSVFRGPQSGSIVFYVTTKQGGEQLAQLPNQFDRSQLPEGGQVTGIKFFP